MKLPLDQLANRTEGLDEASFKRDYPNPALVFFEGTARKHTATFETTDGVRIKNAAPIGPRDATPLASFRPLLEAEAREILEQTEAGDEPAPRPEKLGSVVFVAKSDRNPFTDMLIVGRAPNSDLCIPDSTVSKVHAYLRFNGAGWMITDHGSTNGTYVNGKRLKEDPVPLADGTVVDFGTAVRARFYTPEGLLRFIDLYRLSSAVAARRAPS